MMLIVLALVALVVVASCKDPQKVCLTSVDNTYECDKCCQKEGFEEGSRRARPFDLDRLTWLVAYVCYCVDASESGGLPSLSSITTAPINGVLGE